MTIGQQGAIVPGMVQQQQEQGFDSNKATLLRFLMPPFFFRNFSFFEPQEIL